MEINVGFKVRDVYNEVLPHNKHGYDNTHAKDVLAHLLASYHKRGLFDKAWSEKKVFLFIADMMATDHSIVVTEDDYRYLIKVIKKSSLDNYLKGELLMCLEDTEWDKPEPKAVEKPKRKKAKK